MGALIHRKGLASGERVSPAPCVNKGLAKALEEAGGKPSREVRPGRRGVGREEFVLPARPQVQVTGAFTSLVPQMSQREKKAAASALLTWQRCS